MPAFSFHRPKFLRFHRSRGPSPEPSPPASHDDAAVLNAFPSSTSRPSSGTSVLEQDANAAIGTSKNASDPQHCTGRLLVDRAPQDVLGQPSQTLQPAVVTNTTALNSAQMLSPQNPVALPPAHLPCPLDPTSSVLSQESPEPLHAPYSLETSSQQPLDSQYLTGSSSRYSSQLQHQNQGILNHAHHFTMTKPTFIESHVNIVASNQFMEKLLDKTIPGAAFDSSARYPPPRCHPGTRLAILDRCLYFVANCSNQKKICWVVGAAGVGKSAIMQNVAESPNLPVASHASVFFSINGRSDGTKAVITLSYQFAAKSEPYRRFIEGETARDPSLLQSSMPEQFKKLIVEPFIHHPQLNSAGRVLIIIDGLDECDNPRTQQELLRLISDFCITYPSSPIVWLIASRPETHITSFFSRFEVRPAYEKEEIAVDSNEARADVEQYLRHELTEIKKASDSLDPEWPEERDLWKLASAAGGLFAYAHTVIRYISDSTIGGPASQLSDVLNVIDSRSITDMPGEEHPLALLDALYARILSNVPPKIMVNTRKLLLVLATAWDCYLPHIDVRNVIVLCNWLGMTAEEAYTALNYLRSVLRFPGRDKAHEENLMPFHKSFIDHISDFTRSGFSSDIQHEAQQLKTKCAFRVLNQAPNGVAFGHMEYRAHHGILARGPGTGGEISLTWSVNGKGGWNDNKTRLNMYDLAIGEVAGGMARGDPTFQSEFCIHLLIARFQMYHGSFPRYQLCDAVFAASRREEFVMRGILKKIALNVIDTSRIYEAKLQFCRPNTAVTNPSDPWHPSCTHKRDGEWEEGKEQNWVASFFSFTCSFCFHRLLHQLESTRIRSPDYTVPILFTSTGNCYIEFRFVNPEDGMSEWKYWFWYILSGKERKMYEIAV